MLVLQIILGVLLAVLVLLCVPTGVEACWQEVPGESDPPPDRPPSWELDPQLAAAAAYLKDQGLWPEPPPPPPEHRCRVWVRWGPVRVKVYPPKPKKEKKKPQPPPKKQPAQKPAPKKPSPSLSQRIEKLQAGLELGHQALEAAGPPLRWMRRDLRISLALAVQVGGEDSATVAEDYGKLCAGMTALLALTHDLVRLEHKKVDIRPDFLAPYTRWNARVRAKGHPIVWLAAGVGFGVRFLRQQMQAEKQKQSPSDRKDR